MDVSNQSAFETAMSLLSTQAFFVLGPDFKVQGPVSEETTRIFGRNIMDQDALPLLFSSSTAQTDFRQGLELVFQRKAKPEVVFDLLGSEIQLQERKLRVAYRLLSPLRLLVILTDITRERRFQEISRRDLERRFMVLKAVSHRGYFASFVRDAAQLFSHLADIEEHETLDPALLEGVSRHIHTFKGNAAFMDFKATSEIAHSIETEIQDSLILGLDPVIKEWAIELKKKYYQELKLVTSILGENWPQEADGITFARQDFLQLESWVVKKHATDKELIKWLRGRRAEPLRNLFLPFPEMAMTVAEAAGKRIQNLIIEGGTGKVIPDPLRNLVKNFVHLLRNSLVHGIEKPEERKQAGKNPAGRLTLKLETLETGIRIIWADDGKGIDTAELARKAREQGIIPPAETWDEPRIVNLIFRQGVSTQDNADTLAGRGIGMSAVQEAVQALKGTITVQTRPGRGTSFEIFIPAQRRNPS